MKTKAFSLVEVTLALGIAGFCLIAVFGLLPVSLNSSAIASNETVVNGLINAVAADLRATPKILGETNPVSTQFGFKIQPTSGNRPATASYQYFLEGGQECPNQNISYNGSSAKYIVDVYFPPPISTSPNAACAVVRVSWPALAFSGIPSGSQDSTLESAMSKFSPAGSVSAFVALDRN